MKKLSKITESVWSDIRDRSNGVSIKREDGKKVNSCIGDIILRNIGYDYNKLIQDIISGDGNSDIYSFSISNERNFSTDEMKNIRSWEAPYAYLVYDGRYGTSLVASFSSYNEILDFELDDEFANECVEDDYISICKCISKKIQEVGQYIEYVPSRQSTIIGSKNQKNNYNNEYGDDYHLLLISENLVFYWECENEDYAQYDYLGDYKEDMISEFPELKGEDFICWSYRDGCNIALPLHNFNNLTNFKKYREFTQNWFKA